MLIENGSNPRPCQHLSCNKGENNWMWADGSCLFSAISVVLPDSKLDWCESQNTALNAATCLLWDEIQRYVAT